MPVKRRIDGEEYSNVSIEEALQSQIGDNVGRTSMIDEEPVEEHEDVEIPQNVAENAMSASLTSSALPISRLVYFLRIIATISVPPLEALQLKRIAEPTAGSIMP